MATFTYTARTKAGERVASTLEATDRRAALLALDRLGLIPVSVSERGAGRTAPAARARHLSWHGRQEKMSTRDVLVFTVEMSDLLASGMTVGRALNCLAGRKTGKAGDRIIAAVRDEIVRGSSLSDALAMHPATFSGLYVSMVRAGEASGAMHEVLRRLVEHYERVQEVREKVLMALVYPLIVLVLGAATLLFSLVYVVPKFKIIFEQLGETLPLPTRILITGSSWFARYGWAGILGLVLVGVVLNRAVRTRRGRLWWDGLLLRVPLVRGVLAAGIFANLARTLATLLSNGVPVLQALGIVERTVGNRVIGNEIRNARERVTDGTTISAPLAAGRIIPKIMTDMLAVGEQTGDVSGALGHIARRYENELDRNVKIFTTALEPILIVVVAVLVGFVAISILMAVFNLTNGLNV